MINIKELVKLRKEIDTVDKSIIDLLGKRKELVNHVERVKKQKGIPPLDPKRKDEVLATRVAWGMEIGLDKVFVENLYKVIHDYFLSVQIK